MSPLRGLRPGVVYLEGGWETASQRIAESAPVVGGVGDRAALRFHGTSVSLWGSARAKLGASANAQVSYRCTIDGFESRSTTHVETQGQELSQLCRSSKLGPGEHTIEFEIEEAVEAEAMLANFTLNEESQSIAPRDLVVVPIEIVEVVVVGPDVSTINGTPTTVGWTVIGTEWVTQTGTPFLHSETSTTPTTSSPPPTATAAPPPPAEPQETTTPPPPPPVTSQSSISTILQVSSSRTSASAPRAEASSPLETSPNASLSFVTYTTSRPAESGLPGNTTAGSATAGESSSSLPPGAIVGIALGALAILAAAVIAGWIYYFRQKKRQQHPNPSTVPSTIAAFGTSPSPSDSPRAFSLDRKDPIVENATGTASSGNSMSGGYQGISYTNSSLSPPQHQTYIPVVAATPPVSGHTFLQEDPMARSDDGRSVAPTYYERPPTYRERQSTQSGLGYF